jgi:hypothetical protein
MRKCGVRFKTPPVLSTKDHPFPEDCVEIRWAMIVGQIASTMLDVEAMY